MTAPPTMSKTTSNTNAWSSAVATPPDSALIAKVRMPAALGCWSGPLRRSRSAPTSSPMPKATLKLNHKAMSVGVSNLFTSILESI